jgi:hypothetical protein
LQQANEAKRASDAATALYNKLKAEADNANREAARRADVAQTATRTAAAADDAAKAAAERERQAKVPADTAAQGFAKAKTEQDDTASAAKTALEAMQAVAETQPKSEKLPPIAAADIAAFAHIVGESDAAKKLFCRGPYTVGEPAQPEPSAPVVATSGAAPVAATPAVVTPAATETGPVTVPKPGARPSAPAGRREPR